MLKTPKMPVTGRIAAVALAALAQEPWRTALQSAGLSATTICGELILAFDRLRLTLEGDVLAVQCVTLGTCELFAKIAVTTRRH